jgi:type I restriction enzyme S subunit
MEFIEEVSSGGTPDTDEDSFWDGPIFWLTPKEITDSACERYLRKTERTISESGMLASAAKVVPLRAVMLTKRAPVGAVVMNAVPMATNQGFLNFRCGRKLLPEFLFYWFKANGPYLDAVANGSTYPELYPSDLFEFEIAVPALDEQRAVVDVLSFLDDKIEANQRTSSTLEAMAHANFKSWFVDYDPVRAKCGGQQPFGMDAETAALFSSSFQDSKLGKIPTGWDADEIRAKTRTIQYGLTRSASAKEVGPRFLRITDIQGGRVNWDQVPFCPVNPKEHEKYRIVPGDILIARTGASTGENLYVVDAPDSIFASYLIRLQFADLSMARVVGEYMRTAAYVDYVAGAVGGASAQPNASAQVLASAVFAFPPMPVAKKFAESVEPLDKQRAQNSRQSQILGSLRDLLLPKLISGEIRVSESERMVGQALRNIGGVLD